jgi:hypothetical protein
MTAYALRAIVPQRTVVILLLFIHLLCYPAGGRSSLSAQTMERDWSGKLGIDLGFLTLTRFLLILAAAGTAATICLEEIDEHHDSARLSLDGSFMDPVLDIGNVYGSGWVVGGGSLSLLAIGQLTGNERMKDFGSDLCRSFVYAGIMTGALKFGFNRRRPSGGSLSFPSGHTTSAFSTVPVIWHYLGWQAGVGAGLLAVSTGFGRMEENRHYLSDVLAGAAIGLVVGKAVIGQRCRNSWLDHFVVSGQQVGIKWKF